MALTASTLYQLSGDQLRVECEERGLSCSGPVQELRSRLAEFLRSSAMDRHNTQASVPAGTVDTGMDPPPSPWIVVLGALMGMDRPLFW